MKKFMSRVHLTYGIFISLLCCTFTKGQTAPNVTGIGGETTLFTCPSPNITPGGRYIFLKNSVPFNDDTSDGTIIDGKYNATAGNGEIKLLILNTNISDAGKYTCNHNFVDTSGYVSVAFRPENITTVTTMLTNGWQLTATATKVFPNDSTISSVICLKPDKASLPFGSVGQSVNPNSDIPYLFDISWNGTITEHLSGQVQCTITLVTIETIVRTIVVSFQDSPPAPCSPWCLCNLCECLLSIFMSIAGCIVVAILCCCYFKNKKTKNNGVNGGSAGNNGGETGLHPEVQRTPRNNVKPSPDARPIQRPQPNPPTLLKSENDQDPLPSIGTKPSPDARPSQRPQPNPPTLLKSEKDQDPLPSIGTRSNGKPEGDKRSGVPYKNVLSNLNEHNNQITSQTQPVRLDPIEIQPEKRKKKGKSKRLEPEDGEDI